MFESVSEYRCVYVNNKEAKTALRFIASTLKCGCLEAVAYKYRRRVTCKF